MTVSSTLRKAGPFNGNGVTTAFPFAFKVFAKTDIAVVKTDAAGVQTGLVLDSDYSVALNADQDASPGGTITYPVLGSPLPNGQHLDVVGALALQQPTDVTNLGRFLPQVHEDAFDRAVILIQQLEEQVDRSIKLPVGDSTSPTLPTSANRQHTLVGFDNGGVLELVPRSTLDAQVSAAAQSAVAAASSAGSAGASASAAGASAGTSSLSASAAAGSAAAALAAAQASGSVNFYGTKAEANAALAGLAANAIAEVFVDESMFGFRTRYRKESGVYVLKAILNFVRQFFVDSVAGSDLNNGITRDTPFQTIARLQQETVGLGGVVNLKRGASWREYLNLSTANGVTVQAYGGTGALPVLDGSDLMVNANFTLVSGTTYKISVTRAGYSPRIYENGTLLTRKADVATVNATAGSFVVLQGGTPRDRDYNSVGSVTWDIYVNLAGGSNPISNGKAYEVTMRDQGLKVGNECSVLYVHTRKQSHPDGSCFVGSGGYVRGVLAEDGAKHNLWLTSGLAEDCVTYKNETSTAAVPGDSTHFVAFGANLYQQEVTFRRCKAIQGIAIPFYSHTDGGGNYRRVRFEDCVAINTGAAFSANECDQLVAERCKVYNDDGQVPGWMPGGACVSFTMIDCEQYLLAGVGLGVLDTPSAGRTYEIRGGKFYIANGVFARVAGTGTLNIYGAKVAFDNLGGENAQARMFVNVGNPAGTVLLQNCAVSGAVEYLFGTTAVLNLDNNILNGFFTSDRDLSAQNKHTLTVPAVFKPGDPRNGNWEMRKDIPHPGLNLRAVTHTDGTVSAQRAFLAVGDDGVCAYLKTATYSTDAEWRRYTLVAPSANDLFGVCWISRASSAYVAVGASAGIFSTITDPPGSAWTQRTAPVGIGAATLRAIDDDGAANTVAVGDGGIIIRSTDGGVTWAQITSPTAQNLLAVRFCTGSTWLAVGAAGAVCKSTDGGATWAAVTVGAAQFNCVKYADSKYVIAGDVGTLYTSADATTWTQRYPGSYHNIKSIAYGLDNFGSGQKMWVAVCARSNLAGGLLMRCADPTANAWVECDSPVDTDWLGVAYKTYQDSVFCMVGKGDLTMLSARGSGFAIKQVPSRQSRTGGTPANWLSNALTEMAKL